jgi:hypothetical protein
MRASAYDFQYEPYCWVCGKNTQENIEITNNVDELACTRLRIPVHPRCHKKKIILVLLRGVAAFLGCAAGLIFIGSFISGYFRSHPHVIANLSQPPAWLITVILLLSAFYGLIKAVKAYSAYMDFINIQIHQYTIPAD